MWSQTKVPPNHKTNKERLISLLKRCQQPNESLQATLDRLKSLNQSTKNTLEMNKAQLVVFLQTFQKPGESLQATLDSLRQSRLPQESNAQLIVRMCTS